MGLRGIHGWMSAAHRRSTLGQANGLAHTSPGQARNERRPGDRAWLKLQAKGLPHRIRRQWKQYQPVYACASIAKPSHRSHRVQHQGTPSLARPGNSTSRARVPGHGLSGLRMRGLSDRRGRRSRAHRRALGAHGQPGGFVGEDQEDFFRLDQRTRPTIRLVFMAERIWGLFDRLEPIGRSDALH
jgi:hypothetical protein